MAHKCCEDFDDAIEKEELVFGDGGMLYLGTKNEVFINFKKHLLDIAYCPFCGNKIEENEHNGDKV